MLPQTVQKALNDQVNRELNAWYTYLAMAAYCDSRDFTGCAKWFRIQSQVEQSHAMKLFDFMLDRDYDVKLHDIESPPMEFSSLPAVFHRALEQEQEVTRDINALYDLAFKEKAFATIVELQWFISEQVEEERTLRELVSKFELVKNDPSGLLELDRQLGSRQPATE
jgi:ferritin